MGTKKRTRKRPPPRESYSVRLDAPVLDRVDRLAADWSRKFPSFRMSRADILRLCVETGLRTLEDEQPWGRGPLPPAEADD